MICPPKQSRQTRDFLQLASPFANSREILASFLGSAAAERQRSAAGEAGPLERFVRRRQHHRLLDAPLA
jgi:hypothetical protein